MTRRIGNAKTYQADKDSGVAVLSSLCLLEMPVKNRLLNVIC